jgi:Glycine/sarcosine/betaine reductase selenoprotein B (GRDB).
VASIDELPLKYRFFVRTYRWRRIDPVPFVRFEKRLEDSTLVLISSAGLVLPGQQPFDGTIKGGDSGYRELPADTDVTTLVDTHCSDAYDHSGIEADRNLGFPLERLRALVAHGVIGRLAPRHFSFMGSITAPGRLVRDVAPDVAKKVRSDGVDVALLVPV